MNKNKLVPEIFGINVFNDSVMKKRLPTATYKKIKSTIDQCNPIDSSISGIVANAMKDWAIEKGATHFTHWFQPLTGITAEKHESFISPTSDGKVIMEFSGKELIQGESDASSFPHGGSRNTFEARGYTAWDPTSPTFLKEDEAGVTLFIPTAFYSYSGEPLDKKTPLLRSMNAIAKQSKRILKIFNKNIDDKIRVFPAVGPEQEYFLIDKKYYDKRLDLQLTGRTLFGANPPKGHELNDHYFGSIKERVASYMNELDRELWRLGISAKTKHNEVAPNQYELASIYTNANIATDQNQLIMDTMKKIAKRHGLVCLLHEKPFARINGSGKHNNWSLATNTGINLLEPGKTPHENAQFLLFLVAIIKAVDKYSELIRISAGTPGNDLRFGGNEAPPTIISIFLGDLLTEILENIEKSETNNKKKRDKIQIGIPTLPTIPKDSTDRNRTSPFAFTGNKFEFRMVSSLMSIARANMIINTVVADTLEEFAEILEGKSNVENSVLEIIRDTYKKHKKIIFNGDGYSDKWKVEAKKRKLPNLKTCVDAFPKLLLKKNIAVFQNQKVLSENELKSRYNIYMENYIKQVLIEANTMIDIVSKQILPTTIMYQKNIIELVKNALSINLNCKAQTEIMKKLNREINSLKTKLDKLIKITKEIKIAETKLLETAKLIKEKIIPLMNNVRKHSDNLEMICDAKTWPLPTYAKMLFDI
ncbi:MAG: glutamine synthetase III [Candidatus Marinimicrobia bacterium]|nr:glutamine synthetase III [Candidatus Neomarinimicrobiota bacterium]